MIPRRDLLDERSPPGMQVFQIADHPAGTSHIYMEAPIFTPDSKRFIFQCGGHTHPAQDRTNPAHAFLLCDLESGGEIIPLTEGPGNIGPSMSPDGSCVYYLHDKTELEGGRLELRRVMMDGSGSEILCVIDTPMRDTNRWPSRIYGLTSIRADGRKLVAGAYFGDARWENEPFGLICFDLVSGEADVIWVCETLGNPHPQFCRCPDPAAQRDILVQENHGIVTQTDGAIRGWTGGQGGDKLGGDIHVIRDDGCDLRTLPWGRDGWRERCAGHQGWRGRSGWVIGEVNSYSNKRAWLLESQSLPFAGHIGKKYPGAVRNDLARTFPSLGLHHFATDDSGSLMIVDTDPIEQGRHIQLAGLGTPGVDAIRVMIHLLGARCSPTPHPHAVHPHPFLSPDGSLAFFNSDESGRLQAYMIRNLPLTPTQQAQVTPEESRTR
jgi:hypothetical protein